MGKAKIQSNILAIAGIVILVVGIAFIGYSAYASTYVPAGLKDKNGDGIGDWHDADCAHTDATTLKIVAGPDGVVNQKDSGYIIVRINSTWTSPNWDGGVGDVDGNGIITIEDLDIVTSFFGSADILIMMFDPMNLMGKITYAGLTMVIAGIIIVFTGFGYFKFNLKKFKL